MQISTPRIVVDEINSTPTKAVIITTGGGANVFNLLLSMGRGSNTLLSGIIPYSQKEIVNLLKVTPERFCSEQTARQLAMVAYEKAKTLAPEEHVIGVACTASLQSVPAERKGRIHSIHVALQTRNITHSASLTIEDVTTIFDKCTPLAKNIRFFEEEIASHMILNELALGCGIAKRVEVWPGIESKIKYDDCCSSALGDILEGKVKFLEFLNSGISGRLDYTLDSIGKETVIFPGSFNPCHEGHREMIDIIEKRGKKVVQEISMTHITKPALDFITLRNRLTQIDRPVIISNAPTFVEKSRLYKGTSYIIGYDVYLGILNPKICGEIDYVVSVLESAGNYFYIFPRGTEAKGLYGTADTVLPGEFVVEPRKHEYVSSTSIRENKNVGISKTVGQDV